jgi:hypothetical protein
VFAIEFRPSRLVTSLLVLAVLAGCSAEGAEDTAPSRPPTSRSEFTPGEGNEDPSTKIEGVVVTEYDAVHAKQGEPVAYEKAPPDGGRHDPVWADCNGVVYRTPVRNENMVHSLEHGAVWLAYDPEKVTGVALKSLVERVENQPYLMLSPYPGMAAPISLQSWGHQLQLTDADDPRIGRFIEALRINEYTSPEPGASCDPAGGGFDPANPPPLSPLPAPPGAAPVGGP